jgi:hypothetical protein
VPFAICQLPNAAFPDRQITRWDAPPFISQYLKDLHNSSQSMLLSFLLCAICHLLIAAKLPFANCFLPFRSPDQPIHRSPDGHPPFIPTSKGLTRFIPIDAAYVFALCHLPSANCQMLHFPMTRLADSQITRWGAPRSSQYLKDLHDSSQSRLVERSRPRLRGSGFRYEPAASS